MQARPDDLPPLFTIYFALALVCFWCLLGYLVGLLSGWQALARRFRRGVEPYGETRTAGPFFYTIYMRYWTHYSGVIRLTAASDALSLSILWLFRIGHPPLAVPWSEVTVTETRRFLRRYIVLTLGREEQIPVRISERMARKLGVLERLPAKPGG